MKLSLVITFGALFYLSQLCSQTFSDIEMRADTAFIKGDSIPYTGDYTEYYPGWTKITGTFKDGVKIGTFRYYDTDGFLLSIENYQDGIPHGEFIKYYLDKYLQSKENYNNGLLDGTCYYWAPSGELDCLFQPSCPPIPVMLTPLIG
jgi:antitoxin component YwqK of YwqJK toxin-antitoxin module